MSRKNRPQYHEPADPMALNDEVPIEETLEVGAIMLVEEPIGSDVDAGVVFLMDGPIDPVPFGTSTVTDFGAPKPAAETTNSIRDKASDLQNKAHDITDSVQDKAQDMAQNVTQTAQDIAGKAQDAAGDIAGKAQDLTKAAADKAQDTAQAAAAKAKETALKIADSAATAKTAAANAGSTSKSAVSGAAGTVGMGLWSIVQRSPLQAIFFVYSLVWLLRNNSATAAQTPVSVTDAAGNAAEKVGTISGHVQVAASNLSSQVQTQAQQGAGWFSRTLQENPLVIGAMAVVAGLALGLAVPETSYEHKALGKTRDQLLDKATEAATDLGHKVQTVAQTAVHDAIESGKAEAKNQGLAPQDEVPQDEAPQEQQAQQQ